MDSSTQNMVKIKELHGLIEQRFGFKQSTDHKFVLLAKRTSNGGICAQEQAEYLKKRYLLGVPVRTGAMNVIRQMLNKGAKGVEIIVSGKLRQQRAKSMKFKDGYMIHSGQPRITYMSTAVRHIELRTGIMGIKVRIMFPYKGDSKTGFGIEKPLPDVIKFLDEKKEDENDVMDA
jgi:small subunit ribosomal protein S3e